MVYIRLKWKISDTVFHAWRNHQGEVVVVAGIICTFHIHINSVKCSKLYLHCIQVREGIQKHAVQCTVYSVQCTVYSVQCTVYSVQCTVYSVQCTVYSVQCTVYSVQCTVHSVQCTVYSVQCSVYTVQCTLYTVHCTVYSVHPVTQLLRNIFVKL